VSAAAHPDGGFADADGAPVPGLDEAAEAEDRADALGHLLADGIIAALAEAESQPAHLSVRQRFAWVPITNPRFDVAARLGLMPDLSDWQRGRRPTDAWVGPESAPACGELGCLRYRLDLIDLGPVSLLTTPGALDRAYVDGRLDARLDLGDGRNLDDLDLDGRPDAVDDEIRIPVRWGDAELTVLVPGPANPQRFPAVSGLGRDDLWFVGRTNGGIGSLRTAVEQINVFEGQLDPLARLADRDPERLLCGASFACEGGLEMSALVGRLRQSSAQVLADLPGTRELRLTAPPPSGGPFAWRIEGPDGAVRVDGDRLVLGPRDRAFTGDVDVISGGVEPGDRLIVDDPDPALSAGFEVASTVGIELRRHPNVGDAWRSMAPTGGDLVYNSACELYFEGPCPSRRPIEADPNAGLPRTP